MGEFQGLIDLITMKALYYKTEDLGSTITETEIPEAIRPDAELWREKMLNALADFDEAFAEAYMAHLEGAELSTEPRSSAALRRATLTGRPSRSSAARASSTSACSGCSTRSPPTCPARSTSRRSSATTPRRGPSSPASPSPDEPFCGLVFKITNDAHGDLSFVRIYSGRLKSGTRVYNPGKDKKENCSRLYHIRADDREKIDEAIAGDIVGVVGLKDSVTGDTLCDAAHPILLERIEFPETVISMSIEPVSSADKGKLADTLAALAREDPTFAYKVNEETGQTLISGMGELHLEILKNRMIRDYKPEGARRPAAGQLPRDDQEGRQARRGDVHPPDGRLGALCQGHDRPRARGPAQGGAGARVRQQAQGGRHPRRVPAGDRGGPARGGQVRRPDRLPARRPQGHARRRRRPTTSTPTSWPSGSPRPTPCARRCTRPARCCWNRS